MGEEFCTNSKGTRLFGKEMGEEFADRNAIHKTGSSDFHWRILFVVVVSSSSSSSANKYFPACDLLSSLERLLKNSSIRD